MSNEHSLKMMEEKNALYFRLDYDEAIIFLRLRVFEEIISINEILQKVFADMSDDQLKCKENLYAILRKHKLTYLSVNLSITLVPELSIEQTTSTEQSILFNRLKTTSLYER